MVAAVGTTPGSVVVISGSGFMKEVQDLREP